MSKSVPQIPTNTPAGNKFYVINEEGTTLVELPEALSTIARKKLLEPKSIVARYAPSSMVKLLMDVYEVIRASQPDDLEAYIRGDLMKITFLKTDDCPTPLKKDPVLAGAVEELARGLALRFISDYIHAFQKAQK